MLATIKSFQENFLCTYDTFFFYFSHFVRFIGCLFFCHIQSLWKNLAHYNVEMLDASKHQVSGCPGPSCRSDSLAGSEWVPSVGIRWINEQYKAPSGALALVLATAWWPWEGESPSGLSSHFLHLSTRGFGWTIYQSLFELLMTVKCQHHTHLLTSHLIYSS